DIISDAVDLFFEKGYSETSIADIASLSRVSKETFYLHFENKEDLFMECADRIFYDMFSSVWQEIRAEKDMLKRMYLRFHAFIASYPQWIAMMDMVRSLAVGENPKFKKKMAQLLRQMINPMISEINQLQREGRINSDLDSSIAGYLMMGMAEYGAELVSNGCFTEDEVNSQLIDLIIKGLLRPEPRGRRTRRGSGKT
ncbi:MAG: TetR/AcrR family transcriptional regulator, partial [Smithellaceae bacterium]|nr:TetR/AcrR family transcriptional regulator [Smithellaceae bacterium]